MSSSPAPSDRDAHVAALGRARAALRKAWYGQYLTRSEYLEAMGLGDPLDGEQPSASPVSRPVHLCWVDGDPDDGTLPHYHPCPPEMCEAEYLHNTLVEVKQELKERRACLTGARDDLAAIEGAAVEDGGVWIKAVAERRRELVEAAISETDRALVALGGFDLGI